MGDEEDAGAAEAQGVGQQVSDEQHRGIERQFWKRSFWLSCFTTGIATLAAIFAYLSFRTSQQSLVASERPWISADIPRLMVADAQAPALELKDDGAHFTLGFRLKNFGKSPALRISPHLKVFLLATDAHGVFNSFKINFSKYQSIACDAGDDPQDFNLTVFPTDEPYLPLTPDAKWEDVKENIIGDVSPDSRYALVLAGCFTYHYYGNRQTFHSYVATAIFRTGPDPYYSILMRGSLPAQELRLETMPLGKGND